MEMIVNHMLLSLPVLILTYICNPQGIIAFTPRLLENSLLPVRIKALKSISLSAGLLVLDTPCVRPHCKIYPLVYRNIC